MAELIYVDEEGKELRRETKGKGRPPRGAEKQIEGDEAGNWIVKPTVETARFKPEYVTLDTDGNEVAVELKDDEGKLVARLAKGRGRPKPGFTKQTEGDYAGHWTKVVGEDSETDETPAETSDSDVETDSGEVTVTVTDTETVTDPATTV